MEISTNYITTPKTTRFVTYGHPGPKTKYFWFCLHGSKMVCEQIVYKFAEFDPQEHYIVAPEGMHKLYSEGFGGAVVATWMTKRDRLKEIQDFSVYLSTLYKQESAKVTQAKKILFGFSQGGTTLFRWLHREQINADVLMGYTCWVPEDIDLTKSETDLDLLKKIYTYGTKDQFLTDERLAMLKTVVAKNHLDIEMLPFDGEHKIYKEQLKELYHNFIE